jgi:hypothetical protein
MTWVLIYWIVSFSNTAATSSVGFQDEAKCKEAYVAMRSAKADNQGVWGVCVRTDSK